MKKIFIAAAFLLFTFGNAAMAQQMGQPQQNLKNMMNWHRGERWVEAYRPTEVVVEGEIAFSRYLYSYDEDDLVLIELEEQESGNGHDWTSTYVSTYEYDFNYNPIEILTIDNETGENHTLETFTYSNGLLSEEIRQYWDNDEWINDTRESYNYNDYNYTSLSYLWNGSTWSPTWLTTYTDNGDNIEVLLQYMEGGAWQNSAHMIYKFNDEGLYTEILSEFWFNNAWEMGTKQVYHYSNELYDQVTTYEWTDNVWEETAKAEYTYDSHGNAVLGEHYCLEDNEWTICYGDLELPYDHYYDILVFGGKRVQASYFDVTEVEEQNETTSFTFYPNPVKDVLMIKSDDFKKAEVYSLTGVKLSETVSNKVDVSNLRAGTYLIKVYDLNGGNRARVFVVK